MRDVFETMKDAGATRTPPWFAVVAALASARPRSIRETAAWLTEHADELERSYREGGSGPLGPASLAPELRFQPDLGGLDRSIEDHWLRERKIFAELVSKQTFMQTTVYAISGVTISAKDSELLEQMAIACLTVDARAWPMAVTRRVAGRSGGIAAATVAGLAMMGAPMLAGEAAADCARFLRRAAVAEAEGTPVDATIAAILERRGRVMGFGRPAVGPDERSPVLAKLLETYGRHDGPFVELLRRAETSFLERRGLKSTAAAWVAAVLCDLGLSPDAVHGVTNHWVTVCVFAQATFSHERSSR